MFPGAVQPGQGWGVLGKDLTNKVNWQEAEHFQPPALAGLAHSVFCCAIPAEGGHSSLCLPRQQG